MKLTKESKEKIIHFGLIIFLICSIVILIISMFLVFDLGNIFSDKDNLKVKVVNNFDETVYLECAIFYENNEEESMKIYKSGALEPSCEYVFNHKYSKNCKIFKIDIAVYSSSNYDLEKRIAYSDYDFSDDPYDLIGVISESGNKITITKIS